VKIRTNGLCRLNMLLVGSQNDRYSETGPVGAQNYRYSKTRPAPNIGPFAAQLMNQFLLDCNVCSSSIHSVLCFS